MIKMNRTNAFNRIDAPVLAAKIGIFKIILLLFSDAAPQFEIVVYGQGGPVRRPQW